MAAPAQLVQSLVTSGSYSDRDPDQQVAVFLVIELDNG